LAQTRPGRTRGPLHDEFWAWCGKGELRLQKCAACGAIAWPVVPACEACGSTELVWTPMSGRGKLVSWCSFEKDYYNGMLPLPWDAILVELEEGPLFISNPGDFTNAEARLGMELQLGFLECEDKDGPFRLPVFNRRPLGG
jgi:uncharacterized protein